MKFENPANGYTETANLPFLWCLLFGSIYFLLKGSIRHAIISFVLAVATHGISWFFYPFFASTAIRHEYLRKGWREITENKEQPAPAKADITT